MRIPWDEARGCIRGVAYASFASAGEAREARRAHGSGASVPAPLAAARPGKAPSTVMAAAAVADACAMSHSYTLAPALDTPGPPAVLHGGSVSMAPAATPHRPAPSEQGAPV